MLEEVGGLEAGVEVEVLEDELEEELDVEPVEVELAVLC